MQIEGSTALVTGADRGLGRRFAEELLARGAKVYAGARNPESVDLPGVTPVALDITDPASVEALRQELAGQGTQVTGLHVGYMDTDMARHVTSPKTDPAVVAKLALEGVAAGQFEVVADEVSQQVQRGLAGGVAALYPALS